MAGFKVVLVYEHEYEDCGEPNVFDVIAEYPISEITGNKIKFLPSSNRIKKDLLTHLKGEDNAT